MWPFRKAPRTLGQRGEDIAAKYLKRAGYRIIERNVRAGHNEIDIVAREGDTIVFVEVRTRSENDSVPPEDTVGPEKRRRLKAAARWYIAHHPQPDAYYRFDVIAIIFSGTGKPQITWFQDTFSAE